MYQAIPHRTRVKPLALALLIAQTTAAAQGSELSNAGHKRATITEEFIVVGQPLDSLLNSDDLNRKQANDLDDVFSGISSVLVGGSVGAAQKIFVRNLGEDTLNISVDGARQSGVTYHHTGRITVEPELLQQVQVQVGAGDATHGPGALGGAILFETKDPNELLGSNNIGGIFKRGYFTNTDGHKHSATIFGRANNHVSALVSYVTSDQNNMEDAEGEELPGTQSDQDLAFGKLVGELSTGHSITLSLEKLSEDGDKLMRPEWREGPKNPLRRLEFGRLTRVLHYVGDVQDNDLLLMNANLYHTTFDIYRPWDDYTSTVDTKGLTLSNTSDIAKHNLKYGVDYRKDRVSAGESINDDEYVEIARVLGYFLQDHYQVLDRVLLSFGTRFDQFTTVDKLDNEFTDEGFSPNLGISWNILEGVTLSGGYAEVMRGIETNDGFKLFGTTNDPNLKPERAKNYELGVEWIVQDLTFSAGAHDVEIENAIGNALPWSRHYQNLGDLKSEGYTLGVTYTGERLYTKWTFLDTTAEINDEHLTRYAYGYLGTSTGKTLSADTAFQLGQDWEIGWIASFVEGISVYVASAESAVEKPGYSVHDFYLRWDPHFFEYVNATVTIKNAFNKEYLDHGSVEDLSHIEGYGDVAGYRAPGRDVRFTLGFQF